MKGITLHKVLYIVGAFIITLGLIGGFFSYDSDIAKDYSIHKQVYEELPENPYSQDGYVKASEVYTSMITIMLVYMITGFISGIVFIALGSIVKLLTDIKLKINDFSKESINL